MTQAPHPAGGAVEAGGTETTTEGKVLEILARLWCLAEGTNPDELISDAGHTALCGTLGGLDPRALRLIRAATSDVMQATGGRP